MGKLVRDCVQRGLKMAPNQGIDARTLFARLAKYAGPGQDSRVPSENFRQKHEQVRRVA